MKFVRKTSRRKQLTIIERKKDNNNNNYNQIQKTEELNVACILFFSRQNRKKKVEKEMKRENEMHFNLFF